MTSKPGEKSRRLIVQPATQGHDNDGSGLQEWVSETNAGTNFLAGLRCGLTFTAPLSHYFEAKRDSASVSGQDTDLWRGGKTGMTKPVESPAAWLRFPPTSASRIQKSVGLKSEVIRIGLQCQ